MDGRRFDTLLRSLATTPTRRSALRLLSGTALASLLTLGAAPANAKKKSGGKKRGKKKKCKEKGKETICHQGQTIQVSRCAVKAHLKHDDTVGACATPNPGPPPPFCTGKDTCQGSGPAPCNQMFVGAFLCNCHVAVGSGAPHCGRATAKPCTAETGCAAGETCVEHTGCSGNATACSAPCENPL